MARARCGIATSHERDPGPRVTSTGCGVAVQGRASGTSEIVDRAAGRGGRDGGPISRRRWPRPRRAATAEERRGGADGRGRGFLAETTVRPSVGSFACDRVGVGDMGSLFS
jgi:hypothetical protein